MKQKDAIGHRFGKLVVQRFSHRAISGNYYYVCMCDCGKEKSIEWGGLCRGAVTTCGCGRQDKADEQFKGKRFERFIVLERTGEIKGGEFVWKCLCDCGKEFTTISSKITRKRIVSCGCKRKQSKRYDENGNLISMSDIDKVLEQRFSIYKQSARKRGKEFKLNFQQFSNIIQASCTYCGAMDTKISIWTGKKHNINGIDRMNPKKGYTLENSVPCCEQCNKAKLDYSVQDFKSWAKRLYHNLFVV